MTLRKTLTLLALAAAALVSGPASAAVYYVTGVIVKVYSSTATGGGTATMIQVDTGLYNGGPHPWCGNRAYIDMGDKEIYASAIAAGYTKAAVSVLYDDAAASRNIPGHQTSTCKVLSIYQQ